MDHLSALLARTPPRAKLFFTGKLCEDSNSHDYPDGGYLHLLRDGELTLYHEGSEPRLLTEQTLILFPNGLPHRMEPHQPKGCDLVCASVSFGQGSISPLQLALPDALVLPLSDIPILEPVLALLFDEASSNRYGQESILTRLLETLLILLLRHSIEHELCQKGVLAGLSDPRLARAIAAMHLRSDEEWTVATLAQEAGMSRARFAAQFQTQIGLSPLSYLTRWRMSLACQKLLAGESITQVALATGYSGNITFSRAFEREFEMSPGRWMKMQKNMHRA
ncbi:AraC family transcriptional regulator [Laribacter hongkongensis]|uniref:AraC family transcriptional regulator n=1 Tax=Laribacter hongkongensis TaxID=168471 RepID=UPI001EFD755C|nr:AraC family transcriptional regulator [Laribacter hongkongensis]MCG8996415.1 AraC family transcriptional regulator [Laribacter hongkongensis]MCG9011766.1 AraC family transcriptional regulator [Laribacter hongkongensis]MCG9022772.1 AraC family transcriptional regulator [Laribacter hongkongensis]MCG9048378.1 AraC family transcriptional regulator [Laribacter hongkongensis]MCG9075220.1 AraC family transcriptional regulator [Laribacter hongkongensis]